jgi:hypothetical protein
MFGLSVIYKCSKKIMLPDEINLSLVNKVDFLFHRNILISLTQNVKCITFVTQKGKVSLIISVFQTAY